MDRKAILDELVREAREGVGQPFNSRFVQELADALEQSEARAGRMRDCLAYYADNRNWEQDDDGEDAWIESARICADAGERARKLLESL